MALYRRKNGIFYIDLIVGRRRIRKSTQTKDENAAKELHDKIAHERWQVEKLGAKPRKTWKEVVVKYIKECHYKKSLKSEIYDLRFMNDLFQNLYVDEIDNSKVDILIEKSFEKKLSVSSVNIRLGVLRMVLRRCAYDWEWLDKIPKIKLIPNKNERIRWLTFEESKRLLAELPTHLRDMAAFTLATGLRKSNVTGLKWRQVNLESRHAFIHHAESKTKKAIPVPLNQDAVNIIRRQPSINEYIFNFEGNPIKEANTKAFRNALKRAGIYDFHWHDLRHTWASWHVQNGTTLQELQQLGGWSTFSMVLRYAHLSSDHLQAAANRVSVTNMTHRTLEVIDGSA